MKAMILAAGRGLRMLPLTLNLPKPLLAVKGTPLIVYHLQAFRRAGIHEIVINLGHLGSKIEQFLGDGRQWGVQIHYSYEDPILETGGGIAKALPLLGTDPFLVVSSDVFTDFPFEHLPREPQGLIHLVMVDNPSYHPKGDYALQEGNLLKTGETLFNFGGIGIYRPALFMGCPEGAFPVSTLFEKAINLHQATGEYYRGFWHNIGTPEQLAILNDL
jgi:N-acetyl-alpha-D-muramate 1-phosphate uridylyltransferase